MMRRLFNSLGNNSAYKEEIRSHWILSISAFGLSRQFSELLDGLLDRGVSLRIGALSKVHFGGCRLERKLHMADGSWSG